MPLPPSVKVLLPSLSLDPESNIATLSVDDLRRVIAFALENVVVDEDWYITQYSDVREDVQARGSKYYAAEHYRLHGFLEGRFPHDPVVDEEWYRKSYPDIDEAIRLGRQVDGKSHFVHEGYHEGRKPAPDVPPVPETTQPAAQITPSPATRRSTRMPLSRVAARPWPNSGPKN